MTFSVAPLLLHHEDLPPLAARALRDAFAAPAERRVPHLELAAAVLHRELDLDCRDARELVGLPASQGDCSAP
jgi:hypothetical protein